MSGFKLIAIIPLKGCSSKFRKNLEVGFPYKFYNQYDIRLNDDKSDIFSVLLNTKNNVPKNLYSLKNGINLNISAVVGKNGTGKSTLFELLYYLIYILSTQEISNKRTIINTISQDLEYERDLIRYDNQLLAILSKAKNGLALGDPEKDIIKDDCKDLDAYIIELIKKYKLYNCIGVIDKKVKIEEELFKLMNSLTEKINYEKEQFEPLINSELNLSVLYEDDGIIKEVKCVEGIISFYSFSPTKTTNATNENYDLSSFFYNISLNYSHHGLNSNILGPWINKLFHKNDAYTTPVVINPMRHNGNFDINHEIKLSKERLMSNLVFDLVNGKENLILGKYKVSKFIFYPKRNAAPFPIDYTEDFIGKLESSFILKSHLGITKLDDYINYWDFAISYLEKKISRIDENYDFLIHKKGFFGDTKSELQHFILEDKSHVTKKIRQVINFLRITFKIENRDFWELQSGSVVSELTPDKMLDWLKLFEINYNEITPAQLIEYALPGFFNIDFELEGTNGEIFEFGKLSSGEQQMIFNINSISYHLYNLQSVHHSTSKSETKRVKYTNVNIILDEVELYYHPEMQRLLVKNLMDSFENVKNKGEIGIQSINVCFLTHSPFILSDIPNTNILFLDVEETDVEIDGVIKKRMLSRPQLHNKKTFAANIHELFRSGFFMKTTQGAFALSKITEIVEFCVIVDKTFEKSELSKLKDRYNTVKQNFISIVTIVGEEYIANVLKNNIIQVEKKLFSNEEFLKNRYAELEEELKMIKNQLND